MLSYFAYLSSLFIRARVSPHMPAFAVWNLLHRSLGQRSFEKILKCRLCLMFRTLLRQWDGEARSGKNLSSVSKELQEPLLHPDELRTVLRENQDQQTTVHYSCTRHQRGWKASRRIFQNVLRACFCYSCNVPPSFAKAARRHVNRSFISY